MVKLRRLGELVGSKTFESGGRHLVRARQKSGRAEVGSKGEAEVT